MSNQNLESFLVTLCIFRIRLNCFQWSLVQSEISKWVRPTVTSVNRQHKKYQDINTKGKKYLYLVDGLVVALLGAELRYKLQ